MINPSSTIVVGMSGGADSTALLTVLNSLKQVLGISIIAVHVNHGIRQEAHEDEAFSVDYCKSLGIECIVVKKDIPALSKKWNMTEEEAGRKARYDAFSKVLRDKKADYIAVAHHQNDVAETLLMNLFRGTGLHGAGGIRASRDNVIRPLLCVTRSEIEDYLKEKDICYCTDATNAENIHTRNKIRNKLIPFAEREINSGALEHLSRAAIKFAQADEYIRSVSSKCYDKAVSKDRDGLVINLDVLSEEPDIIVEDVILKCFEALTPSRKDITYRHVDMVLRLAKEKNGTVSVDLPYGLVAKREYEFLKISSNHADEKSARIEKVFLQDIITKKKMLNIQNLGMASVSLIEYNGGTAFPTSSYTKWFDYDRIQTAFFRHPSKGDYICFEQDGEIHTKKLTKYMTDEKIPRDARKKIVVLANGSEIAWVVGYRMNCNYKVTDSTKTILSINFSNGGNY